MKVMLRTGLLVAVVLGAPTPPKIDEESEGFLAEKIPAKDFRFEYKYMTSKTHQMTKNMFYDDRENISKVELFDWKNQKIEEWEYDKEKNEHKCGSKPFTEGQVFLDFNDILSKAKYEGKRNITAWECDVWKGEWAGIGKTDAIPIMIATRPDTKNKGTGDVCAIAYETSAGVRKSQVDILFKDFEPVQTWKDSDWKLPSFCRNNTR